ncbi:hypothetical protein ON010_g12263 [Phytophthora cinnamomi]|nr:hypothetical protein ON010_g12263 [Phytophthora cinnamomi]
MEMTPDVPAHAAQAQQVVFRTIGDKMRSFRSTRGRCASVEDEDTSVAVVDELPGLGLEKEDGALEFDDGEVESTSVARVADGAVSDSTSAQSSSDSTSAQSSSDSSSSSFSFLSTGGAIAPRSGSALSSPDAMPQASACPWMPWPARAGPLPRSSAPPARQRPRPAPLPTSTEASSSSNSKSASKSSSGSNSTTTLATNLVLAATALVTSASLSTQFPESVFRARHPKIPPLNNGTATSAATSNDSFSTCEVTAESVRVTMTMSNTTPRPKSRPRTPSGEPYTTSLLRRKRRELQTLRLEAEALGDQLSQLRTTRQQFLPVPIAVDGATQWRSVATTQRELRWRAEKTNRELKVMLAEQQQLRAQILRILQKTQPLEGLDFVLQLQPKVDRPPRDASFGDALLEEMCNKLDWLRLDTNAVFPVVESDTKVSFRWQLMPESNCVQVNLITPVACSAQALGDMLHALGDKLWPYPTNTKRDTNKLCHSVRRKTPRPLDVNVIASLHEDSLSVNALTTYRRYDEGKRLVLVGITKWFLSTGQFVFEDYNWVVISASPEDPLRSCVMKNFCKSEMTPDVPAHAAQAQQIVFRTIGDKMRNFRQSRQDYLLNNFG